MTNPDMTELDPRYVEAAIARLCEMSFSEFIAEAWKVVELGTPYVTTWHVKAICDHLEARARGEIRRLIINVPSRSMKSRLVGVFWPIWVWITRPNTRWLYSSYAQHLSLRDSLHCRDVIMSDWYQRNWGDRFQLREDQNQKTRFDNDHTGFRLASSTGGVGTGEGGDFIIADDPHNVIEAESEFQRDAVLHWWDQSMSTRGNNPCTVCHIVVMQLLHENDLSGQLLEQGGYEHLCLPMEFEPERRCVTSIGWKDPRQRRDELLCPKRFLRSAVDELKLRLGSYGGAGQLQRRPAPLEGGMFKRPWFRFVNRLPNRQIVRRVRYWDLARPHIRIRRGASKGGRSRIVSLWWDAGTLADLTAWKNERLQQSDDAAQPFLVSLIPGRAVKPFSRHTLRKRFRNACKVLGAARVSTLTIHHGRHTFISHALAGGRTLAEVRDAAGHCNVSITSGYLHVAVEDDVVGN